MGLTNMTTLDCSAADSGNAACWPAAVNITVPILCAAVFVALLVIIYWFKSKPPEVTDIEMVAEAKPVEDGKSNDPEHKKNDISVERDPENPKNVGIPYVVHCL